MVGGVSSNASKYLVIESQLTPKYHKILTSFPRVALHYDELPQYPQISLSNREKALAQYVLFCD